MVGDMRTTPNAALEIILKHTQPRQLHVDLKLCMDVTTGNGTAIRLNVHKKIPS